MRVSFEQFSALVSGIYDAALDASRWQKTLEDLVTAFGGSGGAFMATAQRSHQAVCVNFRQDPASVASYNAYYGRLDPLGTALERTSAGAVFGCWEIAPPAEHRRSEFYTDWAEPIGIGDAIAADVVHEAGHVGWLAIGAPYRSEPFASPAKKHLLRLLMPHLQQAMHVQSSLDALEFRQRGALDALDRFGHGVVLFGRDGSVMFANRAATRIAASEDGFAIEQAGIRAARPDENAALQRLIGLAIGKDGRLRMGGTLMLTRRSERQPFVIHAAPTGTEAGELPASGAFVVIVDPEREPPELAPMLRRVYSLTPAEATVACQVLRGEGLQSVADRMSLSVSTVRVHLQSVFDKTHTHRQAELARLLLTIEAGLETDGSLR